MKAVWLSSTYYLDEAVQRLSPNAERMLTRSLAFCGNAESSGYISELNITMLGLPTPKKLVRELVDANIFTPRPEGGWDFRSWEAWNSAGDKLIARQKADRDRQARLREGKKKSRDPSREMSRDVTPPEQRREEQKSSRLPESATDSNGRGAVAATPAADLVRRVIPQEHPPAVHTALRHQASALLNDGMPTAVVEDALRLWLTKSGVGPGVLPSLASDVIKSRGRSNGAGNPQAPATRKTSIGLQLAQKLGQTTPELEA